jgi:hypothetical protein
LRPKAKQGAENLSEVCDVEAINTAIACRKCSALRGAYRRGTDQDRTDRFIERALWLAIEKLTGIVPPTVVEATPFNGSKDRGLINAPPSA